jgi:hypothetical protein
MVDLSADDMAWEGLWIPTKANEELGVSMVDLSVDDMALEGL